MYRPESWKWGLWAQLSPTLSASLNIKCSKHTSNPILATSVHAVCVHVYIPLLAIMIVLEFPPRLSFSSQVSTESLYGTKRPFFLALEELDMSAGGEKTRRKHVNHNLQVSGINKVNN